MKINDKENFDFGNCENDKIEESLPIAYYIEYFQRKIHDSKQEREQFIVELQKLRNQLIYSDELQFNVNALRAQNEELRSSNENLLSEIAQEKNKLLFISKKYDDLSNELFECREKMKILISYIDIDDEVIFLKNKRDRGPCALPIINLKNGEQLLGSQNDHFEINADKNSNTQSLAVRILFLPTKASKFLQKKVSILESQLLALRDVSDDTKSSSNKYKSRRIEELKSELVLEQEKNSRLLKELNNANCTITEKLEKKMVERNELCKLEIACTEKIREMQIQAKNDLCCCSKKLNGKKFVHDSDGDLNFDHSYIIEQGRIARQKYFNLKKLYEELVKRKRSEVDGLNEKMRKLKGELTLLKDSYLLNVEKIKSKVTPFKDDLQKLENQLNSFLLSLSDEKRPYVLESQRDYTGMKKCSELSDFLDDVSSFKRSLCDFFSFLMTLERL